MAKASTRGPTFRLIGGMTQQQQIRAIIFDWAGTMVDYGSRAPATVFQEIFRREGVEITPAQAPRTDGDGQAGPYQDGRRDA